MTNTKIRTKPQNPDIQGSSGLLSCVLSAVSLSTVQADVEMEAVIPRLLSRQHRGAEERLLVFLPVSGRGLYLDLSRDRHRLSEKLPVEELLRNRSTVVSSFSTERLRFYTGFILNHPGSLAALSTSGGLMGLLQVGGHSMFIEPVDKRPTSFSFSGFKHRLWHRRHAAGAQHPPHRSYVDDHRNRSKVGQEARKRRRSFQLSQHPFTVETVVVADVDVVQHHGADAAQRFLLTVMNMVHALFHHSSLGVSLNIKVTKLVLLHTRPENLEVSHHGERSLRSFCHWQDLEFGGDRKLGTKHIPGMTPGRPTVDSAVFVTRTDFCVHKDEPCDTVGIAYLGGACSPRRKCVLVEDNGLNLALTIAHELGHNLGMSHDEDHTNCSSQSHIMSGEWVKGRRPSDLSWSSCSRTDLEVFLRSKASNCLLQTDPRIRSQVRLGSKLPGMNHSVNEQCQILFGINATFCKEMEDLMCAGLWCLTEGEEFCKTKLDAPLEGTECGTDKWCRAGECVSKSYLPQHVDGDWSLWSPWSVCSRTCGTAVRFRQRKCDNPPPGPDGRPCPNASVEHGVCEGPPCPRGTPSFRDLQCQTLDRRSRASGDMLMAVIDDEKPCVLLCSSMGRGPPVLLADRVMDGTLCGPFESDLCVNGRCQKMGCDGIIGSSAQEDSCGICDGQGRSCEVIRGDFNHTKGIGYVEAAVIPAGAWRIRVAEDKPSHSFLAVKDSRQNSINSNWKIELPGDFELAGTVVRYVRRGHWEKMSIKGPTKTPLHLMMLLFRDQSSALHYEYTMSLNTTQNHSREQQVEPEPLFIWTHSTWQDCSVQCGGGEKQTLVSCLRIVNGSMEIVNDSFCQPENRPLPKTQPCNSQHCNYKWTAGQWGACSSRCGPGVQQRAVSCVEELQNGSLIHSRKGSCSGEKPSALQDCEGTLCRRMWETSDWSKCSSACGPGVRRRKVQCTNPHGPCEPQSKPTEEEPCSDDSECYQWKFGDWSKCSLSCGRGLQSRVVQCMHIVTGHHGDSCPVVLRPPTYRKCYHHACAEEMTSVPLRKPG
ncbi:A disintegrin and metalloproteinase with thrombospondin motifs 17 isoform X2 [Oryzias melastigma]|uniref:A disintegrin and metalloproteinase with thrombospondin motifs 17 isoform X2 n=1 Tax=Oryzias melastigma TaxID=30732 RepID=UPI000CF80F11|nr:A disintegrin and metalloproteinase with thrombospondin motifs 17 isoform X2 [Oryzias melastigma]